MTRIPKVVYQDIEEVEYVPVPHIVQVPKVVEVPVEKPSIHAVERVVQVPKAKLVPIEKEVPEYVPMYVDVEVDYNGVPLGPAPPLSALLEGIQVAG